MMSRCKHEIIIIHLKEAQNNLNRVIEEEYHDLTYSLTEELANQYNILDEIIKDLENDLEKEECNLCLN